MSQFPNDSNPYSAPNAGQPYPNVAQSYHQPNVIPTFTKVVAIIGIVFSSLRLIFTALGVVGYLVMRDDNEPILQTLPFELVANLGLAVLGFATSILMLMGKKPAITTSMVLAFFILLSFVVGFWQLSFLVERFNPGSPEFIDAIVGGLIFPALRLVWVIIFYVGIAHLSSWLKKGNGNRSTNPQSYTQGY